MSETSVRFWFWVGALAGTTLVLAAADQHGLFSEEAAAWLQAVGSVAAVVGASWIASRQSREAALREARDRETADKRDREAATAQREAAVTLLIAAQIDLRSLASLCEKSDEPMINGYAVRGLRFAADNLSTFPTHILSPAAAVAHFAHATSIVVATAHLVEHIDSEFDKLKIAKAKQEILSTLTADLRDSADQVGEQIDEIRKL